MPRSSRFAQYWMRILNECKANCASSSAFRIAQGDDGSVFIFIYLKEPHRSRSIGFPEACRAAPAVSSVLSLKEAGDKHLRDSDLIFLKTRLRMELELAQMSEMHAPFVTF